MRRSASLQRLLIFGLSGPIIALNLWLLSQIFHFFEHSLTILAIAAILAFLLNYPVRFFERAQITRVQAVILVLLVTFTIFVIVGVTLVPVVIDQLIQVLNGIPAWLERSKGTFGWLDDMAKARHLRVELKTLSSVINASIEAQVQVLAGQAVGFALGTVSGLLNLVLVVVLAFYMLIYGEHMWQGLLNLVPLQFAVPFNASLQMNFHKFFLSQLLLGLFMVITLTPIFLILKVPFALLFALLIGVGELIPFIGATLGIGLVTILVLFQNWWLALQVALAAVLMQQVKDNLLAPKLMGDFTGLNPVWIFTALLMGAEIARFLGVLLAVPIAGTIKGTIDTIRNPKEKNVVPSLTIRDDPKDKGI